MGQNGLHRVVKAAQLRVFGHGTAMVVFNMASIGRFNHGDFLDQRNCFFVDIKSG